MLDEAVHYALAHETPWPRDLRAHLETGFFEPAPDNAILGPIRPRGGPNGLIIHHGYGHSSRDKSSCTDSIMKAFILNGTLPKEQETSCYADGKPYLYERNAMESSSQSVVAQDPIQIWREHIQELRVWNPRLVPRR